MSKHVFVAAALVATLVSGAASATTAHFDSAFFFGDSLTDDGNLYAATGVPMSPPYFEGRFSNGPVWADYIGGDFAAHGLTTKNFAFGGATAVDNGDQGSDLGKQIAAFKASGIPIGAHPIGFIWIGANDAFQSITTGQPGEVATAMLGAVNAIGDGITSLLGGGIRDFMVFNMPPLDDTPRISGGPGQPLAAFATGTFNTLLDAKLKSLAGVADISVYDVNDAFQRVISDPAAYGITNTTQACLTESICATPNQYLFWDGVHPSATIHAEIADEIRAQVAPVPLPAPMLLVVVGMAALGAMGARRRL